MTGQKKDVFIEYWRRIAEGDWWAPELREMARRILADAN